MATSLGSIPSPTMRPLALIVLLCAACSSTSKSPPVPRGGDAGGAEPATMRPPVMVDGAPIPFAELWPLVAEAGGADAVREAVIDRQIEIELSRRGFAVSDAEVDAERTLLLESLSPDGDNAARLVEALRRRDGLGPARYAALLRRNAALRALVRDQTAPNEQSVAIAYDLTAGPKRQARIIAASSLGGAESAAARVRGGANFADVAIELSTDSSAARGGLLEPFARQDPSYPESLRAAVFALKPGEVSAPTLLPQGYVVATLVREIPATGESLEALRPKLERAVTLTQQRMLMDQLARRMLRDARVTVFDDGLNWAWAEGS